MERRWGMRLVVDAMARLDCRSGHSHTVCLHDVSLSGAFLSTSMRVEPMTRIWLKLSPGDGAVSARTTRTIEAYVVRQTADGLGIEWCDFAPPMIALMMSTHEHKASSTR